MTCLCEFIWGPWGGYENFPGPTYLFNSVREWNKWHWLSWANNTRLDSQKMVSFLAFSFARWGMVKFTIAASELWSRALAERNRQIVFFGAAPWSFNILHSFLDIFTLFVKYVHCVCLAALSFLTLAPVVLMRAGNLLTCYDFLVQIISTRTGQMLPVNHRW